MWLARDIGLDLRTTDPNHIEYNIYLHIVICKDKIWIKRYLEPSYKSLIQCISKKSDNVYIEVRGLYSVLRFVPSNKFMCFDNNGSI